MWISIRGFLQLFMKLQRPAIYFAFNDKRIWKTVSHFYNNWWGSNQKRRHYKIALSLDGSKEEIHDNFRGIKGKFNKTIEILNYADKYNLKTQIHTNLTEFNYQDIPD